MGILAKQIAKEVNREMEEKYKQKFKLLGIQIKKLRDERNLTIKELSEKTGIKKEYLEKIENRTAYGVLIDKHLLKIAKALKVHFYQLLEFE